MAGCQDCPNYVIIKLDGLSADGCSKKGSIAGENYNGKESRNVCCTYPKCPFGWK